MHWRIDLLKLTAADDVISKLTEIEKDGSLDELWTESKVSINQSYFNLLGKANWSQKDWISSKTLN